MSSYVKVVDKIVVAGIVAEKDFFDIFVDTSPGQWIQTSYNTHGGQHPENRPLRKNFAGIGYTYDAIRDAFIAPKPFASWLLNEESCQWTPPVAYPTDEKMYQWDESTIAWVES